MTIGIPTLQPDTFRQLLMADVTLWKSNGSNFNNFYIRDLSNDAYTLKLPLPPHRKTVNDFILLREGSMIKSAGLDTYEVSNNSIFIVPSGQITTTQFISKDIKGYYCHFSNSFLTDSNVETDMLRKFPFLEWMSYPVLKVQQTEMDICCSLLKRIATLYNASSNFELIKSYLMTILTEIKSNTSSIGKIERSSSERIAYNFKHALIKHSTSFKHAEQYAALLNITTNHLNRCVKSVFGKTTSEIIQDMLLLEAKVLLHQAAVSISEISYKIGFEDPSYFGRFFKRKTGLTPTEFRNIIDLSG